MAILRPGSFVGMLTTLEILDLPVEDRKAPNFVYDTTANELRGYVVPGEAYPSLLMSAGGPSPGNDLDEAYDEGGAGAGRQIEVDAGPVWLDGSGVAGNTAVLDIDGHEILRDQAADPGAAVAGQGFAYSKDVGGNSELFWMNTAGVVQITGGGSLFHSLQQAYDDGNTITIAGGLPVDITNALADASPGIQISRTNGIDGSAGLLISLTSAAIAPGESTGGILESITDNAASTGGVLAGSVAQMAGVSGSQAQMFGNLVVSSGVKDGATNDGGFFANIQHEIDNVGNTFQAFVADFSGMTVTNFGGIFGLGLTMPDDTPGSNNPIIGVGVVMPGAYSGTGMMAAKFIGDGREVRIADDSHAIYAKNLVQFEGDNVSTPTFNIEHVTTQLNASKIIERIEADLAFTGSSKQAQGLQIKAADAGGSLSGSAFRSVVINETALAGSYMDYIGISMAPLGEFDQGNSYKGVLIAPGVSFELDNAAADFRGFEVDTITGGFTLTNFNSAYGALITMPATYVAGDIVGAKVTGDGRTVDICTDTLALEIVLPATDNGIYINNTTNAVTDSKDIINIDVRAVGISADTIKGYEFSYSEGATNINNNFVYGNWFLFTHNASSRVNFIGSYILLAGTAGQLAGDTGYIVESQATYNNGLTDLVGFFADLDGATLTNFNYAYGVHVKMPDDATPQNNPVYGMFVEMPGSYSGSDMAGAKFTGGGRQVSLADTVNGILIGSFADQTTAITRRGLYIDADHTINNASAIYRALEVDMSAMTDTSYSELQVAKMTDEKGLIMYVGGNAGTGAQPQGYGVDISGYDYFYQHAFNVIGTPNTNDWITGFSMTNITPSNNCVIAGIETNFTTAGAFNYLFVVNCYPDIDHNVAGGIYGMDYRLDVASGVTVTESYGINILNHVGTGTVTTEIGIHTEGATCAIEVGSTPSGRWFDDGDMVLGGNAMSATEKLRVVGDVLVDTGDLILQSDQNLYFEGAGSDTYMTYNSGTGKVELWVDGTKEQEWG